MEIQYKGSNQTNFKGKIFYTSKEARHLTKNARESINILKHHCGNNNFEHYISVGDEFVGITTYYKRNIKRTDGVDAYNLKTIVINNSENKLTREQHHISAGDEFIDRTIYYKRNIKRTDGVDTDIFNKLTKDHLVRYKRWKTAIDIVPKFTQNTSIKPNNFWQKFINSCKNMFKSNI